LCILRTYSNLFDGINIFIYIYNNHIITIYGFSVCRLNNGGFKFIIFSLLLLLILSSLASGAFARKGGSTASHNTGQLVTKTLNTINTGLSVQQTADGTPKKSSLIDSAIDFCSNTGPLCAAGATAGCAFLGPFAPGCASFIFGLSLGPKAASFIDNPSFETGSDLVCSAMTHGLVGKRT
jgi:hypothetical protein